MLDHYSSLPVLKPSSKPISSDSPIPHRNYPPLVAATWIRLCYGYWTLPFWFQAHQRMESSILRFINASLLLLFYETRYASIQYTVHILCTFGKFRCSQFNNVQDYVAQLLVNSIVLFKISFSIIHMCMSLVCVHNGRSFSIKVIFIIAHGLFFQIQTSCYFQQEMIYCL